MESGFIRHLKDAEKKPDGGAHLVNTVLTRCQALTPGELPPLEMMNVIGSHNAEHFKGAMLAFFQELVVRGRVTPSSNILDLGCGCGRLAIPFSFFLNEGRYYGVDVWPAGIEWCRQNLFADKGNATFLLKESGNNYYFEDRTKDVINRYELQDIPDDSLDFAFAISVFTHLTAEDCRSYLQELARTLRSTGVAYLTSFIIDRFFFDYVRRTGQHRAVRQEGPGYYYAYRGQDFFAGFTPRAWRDMLDDCGLTIIAQDVGQWAQKPGSKQYQDTFIVMRN